MIASHVLGSEIVGLDFEISVRVPPNTTGPLPVVFTTDANVQFGFMADLVSMLSLGGEIPPVLLVGIGYPVGDDLRYVLDRRTHDLIEPTWDGPFAAAGAPAFLRFITDELWPWLEQRHHVSDDRTLRGHSAGGQFALWTLFHHHGFFGRYIIGSPGDVDPDTPSRWLDYEQQYARDHDDLDAIVYLACGGAEHDPKYEPEVRALGEALAARGYPRLRSHTRIFPDDSHFTAAFTIGTHGLRWVFDEARRDRS